MCNGNATATPQNPIKAEQERIKQRLRELHERDKDQHNYWAWLLHDLFPVEKGTK